MSPSFSVLGPLCHIFDSVYIFFLFSSFDNIESGTISKRTGHRLKRKTIRVGVFGACKRGSV